MNIVLRRVFFSLIPLVVLFVGSEVSLRSWKPEADLQLDRWQTEGLPDQAWLQRRDRHLGRTFTRSGERWLISDDYLERGMNEQRILAQKSGTRLIALGGSTTAGVPFTHDEAGFPERLSRHLTYGARQLEVINMGIPGMDSSGFEQLINNALPLDPDGFIIYAGNNEFPATALERCLHPVHGSFERALSRLSIYRFLRHHYLLMAEVRPTSWRRLAELQDECMLQAAQKAYSLPAERRIDPLALQAERRFKDHLTNSIKAIGELPLWLVVPPINLQHSPKLSFLAPDLDEQQKAELEQGLTEAKEALIFHRYGKARRAGLAIIELDPTFADGHYIYGMALLGQSRREEARAAFLKAVSYDWLPDRITPQLQQVVREVCAEHPKVECVDLDMVFNSHASGVPGSELFVDFCHPTFKLGVDLIVRNLGNAIEAKIYRDEDP